MRSARLENGGTSVLRERGPAPCAATVLVVEDEPAIRALVERILKGAGYAVVEADSAAHAREVLETARCAPGPPAPFP